MDIHLHDENAWRLSELALSLDIDVETLANAAITAATMAFADAGWQYSRKDQGEGDALVQCS